MSKFTTLRHATPTKNVSSIRDNGLDPAYAKGRMRVVWLHNPGASRWKIPHVAQRHGVACHQVSLVKVRIPRCWIKRRGRGCWSCDRIIPVRYIVSFSIHICF